MRTGTTALFFSLAMALALAAVASAQCFTEQESKKAIESVRSAVPPPENEKVRAELMEMRLAYEKLDTLTLADVEKDRASMLEQDELNKIQLLRICEIIKENGWLTKDAVKFDGFDALMFIISRSKAVDIQRQILPVLLEAGKKGYIEYPLLASLVDSVRVGTGLPQVFGTQARVVDHVIYLYPLLSDDHVDEWRKLYKLPPLATEIRNLEGEYLLPLVRSPRRALSSLPARNDNGNAPAGLGIGGGDTGTLKIDTRIVNLNIRVLTRDAKTPGDLTLTKDDLTVLEDGVQQDIAFFSTNDAPFDLVLLLDFSGSTNEKRGLIRDAAQRFVKYARPRDRIAVVAFGDEISMVSDLTTDKKLLTTKIKSINLKGVSPIWDSLQFTYDKIIGRESSGRRSAVVFMTDGVDTSTGTTYADVMERVRQGDTTIFPVYLSPAPGSNTSMGVVLGGSSGPGDLSARLDRKARLSLAMLADESGGQFYAASDIKDLNGIYEQVINDLGRVYSVGYEPKNDSRGKGWRNLAVKIKSPPNLIATTRRGYYAN